MSYGIIQFYLPPDRGDVPALISAEGGTQFAVPPKVAGRINLVRAVEGAMAVVRFEPGICA